MRNPAGPDDNTPPATPKTPRTNRTGGSARTDGFRTLSADQAGWRSPSPFEASTVRRSRNNSMDTGPTTQGDLFDATPARETEPPLLTISSAGTSDDETTSSDGEDDIIHGVSQISLGVSEGHEHVGAEGISTAFDNLNFNQQATSTGGDDAPYSMRDEPLPPEPYYDQGFQTALKTGTQLAGKVASCLERCPKVDDPESSLHKLSEEALRSSNYKSPTTRTIGIIGKSSLINSLLHVTELAITGSAGTAVTAFATEYRYQPAQNAPRFTITAYCLNQEEIEENLGELLEEFRKPYLIGQSELTVEEFRAAENRSEAARTIFLTAFGSCDDFSIEEVEYDEGGYERAFECLKRWARQLKWPTDTHNGRWEASANTEDICKVKTEPFLSLGLWPFVKRVVIYLRSPVLRNGLVLADLPGYHDVNFARVAVARKFQSTCDEIFVVTDIKRGVDDPVIKEVIQDMSTTADVGKITRPNITVICSHTGELGSAADKRKLKQMVPASKIKHAQKQIDKVDRRQGRFSEAKLAIREAEMNMNGLLIQVRNEQVKNQLQTVYAESFSPKRLPVFCIDNAFYQEQDFPQAVKMSGIPDLRRYCLSLPGRALFRSADIFLGSQLPALVNSLEIWLEAAHTAGTQSFSNILDVESLHDDLDFKLETWKTDFSRKCRDSLKTPCNRKEAAILAEACSTCDSWNSMHHTSYLAWVRHDGTYSTKTVKHKCWNTELVGSLNHVLTRYWVSFDSDVENDLYAVSNELQDNLKRFQQAAKGRPCAHLLSKSALLTHHTDARAPNGLIKNLKARERLIRSAFDDGIEDFLRSFRLIKHNATSGHSSSYMLSYMRPVYKEGQQDRGTGVWDRNISRIHAHVNDSSFVTTHATRVCADLKELAERTVDSLSEKVHSILEATDRDLETLEAPDSALLEKYPAFGRSVEDMLFTARTELKSIEANVKEAREEARNRGYI